MARSRPLRVPRSRRRGRASRPTNRNGRLVVYAPSTTSANRRSPRASIPSSHEPVELMHFELDPGARGFLAKHRLLAKDLVVGVHGAPLERRVGFRHVCGHADGDPRTPVALDPARHLERAGAGSHDLANVVVFLGGQPNHEVELHLVPSTREHALGGLHELLFGDVLVDDVAHALAAGLGRERQASRALTLQVVEHVLAQPVRAQG